MSLVAGPSIDAIVLRRGSQEHLGFPTDLFLPWEATKLIGSHGFVKFGYHAEFVFDLVRHIFA